MRQLIAVLLCMWLGGCSWLQPVPTKPLARIGLKLAPATLGTSIDLQQHLIVERADRIDQLDTVLEVDPQCLDLVGLAFGQRVMTLHYDGVNLQIWRHPMLPKQIRGEDVLEDLQLTLWPINAIRKALPVGWSITENNKQRTLLLNNIPIMIIKYSNKHRWDGKIVLTNLRYHYRLIIQSVTL
jgi:hypothetical protein